MGVAEVQLPDGRKARIEFTDRAQLDATISDLTKTKEAGGTANFRAADLPPLPRGYKLVQPQSDSAAPAAGALPPLPPGYHLVGDSSGAEAVGPPRTPTAPTYGERVEQAGQAFDAAVGNQGKITFDKPGALAVGRTALAAGETALSMGSGIAGDIAGAATSLFTQDPKRGEAVRKGFTYEPRTEAGRTGQAYVGSLVAPVGQVLDKPRAWLEAHGMPIAAQTARAALDVAPLKVPRLARAGADAALEAARPVAGRIAEAGESAAAVRAAEQAPKQAAITSAKNLGIRLPPSQAGGSVSSLLETAGGKIQTEQHLSRVNAKIINAKAGADIGLTSKESLSPENLARQEAKAIEVYEKVKQQGRIELDDTYRADLEKARSRTGEVAKDFPGAEDETINKLIDAHDVASADARSLVTKVKTLREAAKKNMRGDSAAFERGLVQKKIATAMEEALDRAIPDKSLIPEFRAARQQLAKIYTVQEATTRSGNLNAAVLARQLKRGVPLSGNLRAIAESYEAFPKVLRHVEKLGGHAPLSAVDYLIGGAAAAVNPAHGAALAAGLLARPAARAIIGSKPFQRAVIRSPQTPRSSMIARGARRIAGSGGTLNLAAPVPTTLSGLSR